jgi:hypothetical protein
MCAVVGALGQDFAWPEEEMMEQLPIQLRSTRLAR